MAALSALGQSHNFGTIFLKSGKMWDDPVWFWGPQIYEAQPIEVNNNEKNIVQSFQRLRAGSKRSGATNFKVMSDFVYRIERDPKRKMQTEHWTHWGIAELHFTE